MVVLGLLIGSALAVVVVVKRSECVKDTDSWWTRNEITIVMSTISFFFPMIFETLGFFEYYHPRKQLRIQLARIMVLNLLNLYSLIFALFDKISEMTRSLKSLKPEKLLTGCYSNSTKFGRPAVASRFVNDMPMFMSLIQDPMENLTNFVTYIAPEVVTKCYEIAVNCTKSEVIASLFLVNITSTFIPNSTAITTTLTSNYDNNSTDMTTASYFNNYDYNAEDEHYYLENLPYTDLPIFKRELIEREGTTDDDVKDYENYQSTSYDLFYNFENLNQSLFDMGNATFNRSEFIENVTMILQNFTTIFDSTVTETIAEKYDEFEKYFEEEECFETICEFVDYYKSSTTTESTVDFDEGVTELSTGSFTTERDETTDFRG